MTNFDKWKALTAQLEAPDLWLDMTWLFTVAASLERRVWFGDYDRGFFCNIFLALVGPPGKGKGTCMRESNKLLGKYGMEDPNGNAIIDPVTAEPRRLFYSLGDTITFEKLILNLANVITPFRVSDTHVYAHSSAYFALEELSSLMRPKKAEDVSRFLHNMYDCVPYKYDTVGRGQTIITNGCLNLIAGTQIDFLRRAEQEGMLTQGLFSRMIFAYADKRRQTVYDYGDLTPLQKQYQADLQEWLLGNSKLYGRIKTTPEIDEWNKNWWNEEAKYIDQYDDSKLAEFFSRRKDVHKKLAAAAHFGESRSMTIPLETYKKSADLCRTLESGVIKIAQRTGRNSAFPIAERLFAFIKQRPRENHEIIRFLESEMDYLEIMNTLLMLEAGGRIMKANNEGTVWKTFDHNSTE